MKIKIIVFLSALLFILCACEKRFKGSYNCTPLESESISIKGIVTDIAGAFTQSGCLYDRLEFKDGKNVVIYTMGISVPCKYSVDGDLLRIFYRKELIEFTIKDSKTLIGKDYAKGIYKKE